MKNKLLTIREAAHYLGITEQEVIELSQNGAIPAYKIGGAYLRFKKEQIESFKNKLGPSLKEISAYPLWDKISDFFYYNDFYIFSLLVIPVLIYFIFFL